MRTTVVNVSVGSLLGMVYLLATMAQEIATETKKALGVVKPSPYRQETLRILRDNGMQTPSEIAEASDALGLSNASRALQNLRDVDAVELCVPEDTKKGRLYRLTDTGETVLEMVGDE